MGDRLKYEFSHLAQTTSAGFDSTWYDFTDKISEPDNVVFTFGEDAEPDDVENQISSIGFQRSVTGNLEATNELWKYIKHWLIDHEDASINAIQVRITDVVCQNGGKSLGIWQILYDNLNWCEDGECRGNFTLKEYTPITNCLQQTLVWDNHRNWFPNNDGVPYLKTDSVTGLPILDPHLHPRFRYCDDIKPQALQNFLWVIAQGIVSGLFLMVSVILLIATAIQDLINAVFGSGTVNFADNLQEQIEDEATTITANFIGCGRMHPAPLIRNYFINACSKCMDSNGVRLQFESNIFNDPDGPVPALYNASLLFVPVKEGYKINEGNESSDFRDWIMDNRPNETAITLAHSLKDYFNAKFELQNGVFKFNTKDTFPEVIVYDFTEGSPDTSLLVNPICYAWNAEDKYASTKFELGDDSQDMCGNEARHRYNGVKDWATNNPRYNGIKEIKPEKYCAARFVNDGITEKRIFSVTDGSVFESIAEALDDCLLLQHDTASLYKILVWDGESDKGNASTIKIPVADYPYLKWYNDWIAQNTTPNPYYVFNYPLLFDEDALGAYSIPNIFKLHEIDNPTLSGLQNKSWEVELELCCSNLDRMVDDDVLGDCVFAHLDYLIQLPPTASGQEQKGNIKSVVLDYPNNAVLIRGDIKYTI